MGNVRRKLIATSLLMLCLHSANAATFVVNSLEATGDDQRDGVCETAKGNRICTLTAAIQEANFSANTPDTIQIAVTGTLKANAGTCLLDSVEIQGPATGTATVDGENAQRTMCIYGASDQMPVAVRISRLNFTRGAAAVPVGTNIDGTVYGGGGLAMCGASGSTLRLEEVNITDSSSNDLGGGGLYVCAGNTATLNRVRLTGNRSDTQGGGALILGSLIASDVVIDGNRVTTKVGNATLVGGGGIAIFNDSSTDSSLTRVAITNNSSNVPNGVGGGLGMRVSVFATVSLTDSFIEGNVNSTSHGGGLGINGGNLVLTNVSLSENRATAGDGGGLYLGTEADGANLRFAQMKARQLQVSANTANNGGGIGASAANVAPSSLTHGTVVFNFANSNGAGLGPNTQSVFVGSGSTPFHSNLVAENYNINGMLAVSNCAAAFNHTDADSGYQLSDDRSCGFTQATDQQGVPAQLVNPSDRGGPFRSVGLLATSPAIDRGHPNLDSTNPDARGAPVADGDEDGGKRRDIGAYEFGGFGAVRFAAATASAFEGDGTLTLQAVRYGNVDTAGSATLATESASAQSGSDFTASTANVQWAAGDATARSLSIPLTTDSSTEGDETFRALVRSTDKTADIGRIDAVTITLRDGAAPAGGGTGGAGTGGGGNTGGTGSTGGTPSGNNPTPNTGGNSAGDGGGGAMGSALLALLGLMVARRRRQR